MNVVRSDLSVRTEYVHIAVTSVFSVQCTPISKFQTITQRLAVPTFGQCRSVENLTAREVSILQHSLLN